MPIRELARMTLHSLRAHKLRSFLTLLGVIIGVMTIVAVVGGISGTNQYIRDQVGVLSPDVYVLSRFGIITDTKSFLQAIKRRPIGWEDYERLRTAPLQQVAEVSAWGRMFGELKAGDKRFRNARIQGRTANSYGVIRTDLETGRVFSDGEDLAGAHVAVIGASVREALFGDRDPIGRQVLANGIPFTVVGLLKKQGRSMMGPSSDNQIQVPMQVFRGAFMGPRTNLEIMIKAKGGPEGVPASQDEVRSYMRALRHTGFRDPDPFGLVSQDLLMDVWNKVTGVAFLVMILISGISLTVGGVVIMNIMLVSVAERTQEIGVRRALGARRRDVRRQFLLEAALLSAAGGVAGLVLGSIIVWVVRLGTGFPAQVTVPIVVMSLVVATLVGVLAGFLPAFRAAQLNVIDAIRAE